MEPWVAIVMALIASVLSPLLLAWQINRHALKVKEVDWAREDAVAVRAKEVADSLLRSNDLVAKETHDTREQLEVIHTLVNSNMTASKKGEFDATVRELAMIRAVVALKQANGHAPSVDALAAIASAEQKIAELTVELSDREKRDKIVT